MKYYCPDCQTVYDEEDCEFSEYETFNWLPDKPVYWYFTLRCPKCDEEGLEEAKQCQCCGDWFGEEELTGGLCHWCLFGTIPTERQDIILGFLWENREAFGEYAAEITNKQYGWYQDKKKTAQSSQL